MWRAIFEAVKLSFGSNISLRDFLNIVLSKLLIMIFFKEILCEYFFESSTLLYAHDILKDQYTSSVSSRTSMCNIYNNMKQRKDDNLL